MTPRQKAIRLRKIEEWLAEHQRDRQLPWMQAQRKEMDRANRLIIQLERDRQSLIDTAPDHDDPVEERWVEEVPRL